jgi:hypothetical protein
MEQIINIRDSNWKKSAGTKDSSRLKTNPMDNSNTRLTSGVYVILNNTT